jgi:sensor c-di-GMP phosphodiesterase-like protein
MPLTDLIRYFNVADSQRREHAVPRRPARRGLAWRAAAGSLFQPIVDLRQERVVGHQADAESPAREDGTRSV